MAPRLYLILSDERSGLVKIGRTDPNESNLDDTAVIKRVQELRTGISDSSTVVQAPGAAIFETWLHQFMGEKRKPVTIRFAFRPDFAIRPKEWFDLSPNLAQILAEAFMSKSPQTVDEVNVSDLPIFLAGAMAIIRWHAERESPETLAAMAATAEIQTLVDRMRTTEHLPTQRPELGPTAAISSDKSAPLSQMTPPPLGQHNQMFLLPVILSTHPFNLPGSGFSCKHYEKQKHCELT